MGAITSSGHYVPRERHELFTGGGVDQVQVLLVDDDPAVAEMLVLILQHEGFAPSWCANGDQAVGAFRDARPRLVLFDVMLPGKDGLTICREIRGQSTVPIIMLTAKSDTLDVVAGLEAGADDYMAKPFKSKELIARMRTRLRRSTLTLDHELIIGDLTIDVTGHTVRRHGELVPLTPLEFDLLTTLARRPWHAFSRDDLLQQVWGYRGTAADRRLVNAHIQRLRAKIEHHPDHPQIVLTVRGIGYKASEPG